MKKEISTNRHEFLDFNEESPEMLNYRKQLAQEMVDWTISLGAIISGGFFIAVILFILWVCAG